MAKRASEFLSALARPSNQNASIEVRGARDPRRGKMSIASRIGRWIWSAPISAINAGFSRTVRSGIKRAVKDNIEIDRGTGADYLKRFFDLQLQTRRRLGVPPQPFKFFSTVHQKFSRDGDCEVWFATLDGRDQAGLVVLRNGDQLCCKWSARDEHCHPGANHLLFAKMIDAHAGPARLDRFRPL